MSEKELLRIRVIGQVIDKCCTQPEASIKLRLSIRQIKRLCKAFRKGGTIGLIHKRRGKTSPKRTSEYVRKKIAKIISKNYVDFGPTLIMEMLREKHELSFSKEWIRQLMISYDLWKPKKLNRKKIFQLRSRRSCFGELVQMDGSYHFWFEDRGPKCCLLVIIDDATSSILEMRFAKHESTEDYFEATKRCFIRYGLPRNIYVDKHSTFRVNAKERKNMIFLTQFARAMKDLNIKIIFADTPQAKGRVERANGILQDRMVKMMRLNNISTIEEGNRFLDAYREEYNAKFSKPPFSKINKHEKAPSKEKLQKILCVHEERTISKSLSISFKNQLLQIVPQNNTRRLIGSKVKVIYFPSGEIQLMTGETKLEYKMFNQMPYQQEMNRKHLDAFLDRKAPLSAIQRHRKLISGRL